MDVWPASRSSDDHFAEQWPLSALDDFPIHQTPEPIRMVWTSDVRAYDRHWMVGHSASNNVIFAVGGSVYPNLDMAEGYAIVNRNGRHHAIRATRPLGCDRTDMTIGPIRPRVVRGLREWRFEVDDNDSRFRMDLQWLDTKRQQLRDPHAGPPGLGMPRGRHRDVTAGFEGFGKFQGWIEIDGDRIDIDDDGRGSRDRHWGVRNGIGGPEQLFGARPPRGGNGHQFVDFDDWAIWGDRLFLPFGSNETEQNVSVERRFRFEEGTDLFLAGEVTNTQGSGQVRTIRYERIADLTVYLRSGFYGGPNGAAPGSGWWQGQLPADRPAEGEVVDVSTPEGKLSLSGLNQHLCIAECEGVTTSAIIQTYDPHARRRCENNVPGWSLL